MSTLTVPIIPKLNASPGAAMTRVVLLRGEMGAFQFSDGSWGSMYGDGSTVDTSLPYCNCAASLRIDTGTVTIHGNSANTSALTLGAGASSLSGNNSGDQTIDGILPSQTGNSGKFLTTSGTACSWATASIFPQQAPTASAPAYQKGAIYFDTTLNKLRIGGATAWETVTSM